MYLKISLGKYKTLQIRRANLQNLYFLNKNTLNSKNNNWNIQILKINYYPKDYCRIASIYKRYIEFNGKNSWPKLHLTTQKFASNYFQFTMWNSQIEVQHYFCRVFKMSLRMWSVITTFVNLQKLFDQFKHYKQGLRCFKIE